jgi:hypothetical protein
VTFHTKSFVSLLVTIAFPFLALSGVILYFSPRGRVANWTDWTVFGLDKQTWQTLHISLAILFLVTGVIHLCFNWKALWCYLKRKGRVLARPNFETIAALIVVGIVGAGATLQVPPFSTVMSYNYRVKDYWDQWASESPAQHIKAGGDESGRNQGNYGERQHSGRGKGGHGRGQGVGF